MRLRMWSDRRNAAFESLDHKDHRALSLEYLGIRAAKRAILSTRV